MYPLDPNINVAVERQAERVRAVQAYGLRQDLEQSAPSWSPDNAARPNRAVSIAAIVLAAAAPIALVVVVALITR